MKTRTLKIETVGDFAAHKVKPRIRICGAWLDRAGFLRERHPELAAEL